MTTKLNLNQYPHFDDYKDSNKYYQILFRPGRPVQARELTQLQTMLQRQIERFGKHIFKNGTNVLPGTENAVRYTPGITFIKLPLNMVVPSGYTTATAEEIDKAITQIWLNSTVVTTNGDRAGIKGKIIGYRGPDGINLTTTGGEVRFFINMLSASDNGVHSTFQSGDAIKTIDGLIPNTTATIPYVSEGSSQLKVGTVSSVTVEEGVYFYNGYFLYVEGQTHFLEPIDASGQLSADSSEMQGRWSDAPTAKVGLKISEEIRTFQDDDSMLDNAQGTSNYSAPGADRLYISADLTQIAYSKTENTPDNFISLLEVSNGTIYSNSSATEYGPLMDTIARRTYDQSGDYIVDNLSVQITDFLRDDETKNNGTHSISEFQFLTPQAASECASSVFGFDATTSQDNYFGPHTDGYYYPGTSYNGRNDRTSFKNLCDSFLSARVDTGKAYVKGYEIRKLAKTTIDIPKSRTSRFADNVTINTPLGRYFTVNDLVGNLVFTNFVDVDLYPCRRLGTQGAAQDGVYPYDFSSSTSLPSYATKIGTAKLVRIDADTENGTGYYRAYITDISMIGSNQISSVKMIHAQSNGIFAHPVLTTYELAGAVTSTGTPSATSITVAGSGGTGWFSAPGEILKKNDYLYLETTQEFYRVVDTPTDNATLTLALESSSGTVRPIQNSKFLGTYSTLEVSDGANGVIYPFSESYISTIREKSASGSPDVNKTSMSYTIEEVFSGKKVTGSSITLDLNNRAFAEFDSNIYRYKVLRTHDSNGAKINLTVQSGQSAPQNDTTTSVYQNGDKELTFYFSSNNSASTYTYSIVVPVIKTGVAEKKKNLKYGSFVLTKLADGSQKYKYEHTGQFPNGYSVSGEGPGYKVVDASNNSEIHLGNSGNKVCDIFRITRIVASKDKNTDPSEYSTLNDGDVDVTALYLFDSGQTEYYYGYPKVYLRPNYPKPVGKVRVEYDYFDHDATSGGDYFSVDSYTHADGVPYDEIPFYRSNDGEVYPLADSLDFRRKITDSQSVAAPIDFLTCDYFIYNGRSDKIVLDSKSSQFKLLLGTPTDNPDLPEDLETGMTLVELIHNPYGVGKDSCRMRTRDNRRYTMRDIGKLEKRIEKLEYYTSLSLLEQETSRLKITDANGNDRFKNGFLADNFSSFDSSDTGNFDFSCSIDTEVEKVARPLVSADQLPLIEDVSTPGFESIVNSLRNPPGGLTNYVKVGDLFMLPYSTVDFLSQKIATKVCNVNPFSVFTYTGTINLTPWTDTWRETTYKELNVYDDSAYQEARKLVTGEINYQSALSTTSVTYGERRRTGRYKLLVAGHLKLEKMSPRERQETIKRGKYKVPAGYTNAGEWIPIDVDGPIQRRSEFGRIRTTTVQNIRQGLATDIQKTGVTTTKAVTKDETSDIEFMRTIDVVVEGTSFKPNANLYAYFDDVPVSAHCRPVEPIDANNWTSYTIRDLTSTNPDAGKNIPALPVDSPIRYFTVHPTDPALKFSLPVAGQNTTGKVRVGCEVEAVGINGITRKFDVVGVIEYPDGSNAIQVKEKPRAGTLASDLAALSAVADGPITARVSKYAYGDQLKTSGNGSVKCVFRIPNEDGNRFKTGQAKFVLSSSSASPKAASGVTRASSDFVSKGVLNTQEVTITQTQQYTVSPSLVNDSSSTTVNELVDKDWGPIEFRDPVAQSFLVQEKGGCFITDIDVFFARKPANNNVNITLELRPMSKTGLPEATIVGGSLGTVVKFAEDVVVNKVTIQDQTGATLNNTLKIEVSDTLTTANKVGGNTSTSGGIEWTASSAARSDSLKDGTQSVITANVPFVSTNMSADMVPTRFTFKSPIFLEEAKSYAFVLLSDSDEYEVWVAQRGPYGPLDANKDYGYYSEVGVTNVKIGTTESIDNQELYKDGTFFKSKNGFNWSPDQTVTMKFNLAKAAFQTREATLPKLPNTGEIVYVNETLGWTDVTHNGLEIRPNSDLIRVLSVNHGVSIGDRVRFIFDITEDANGKIRGFSKAALQNTKGLRVVSVEADHFVVKVENSFGSTWSVTAASDLAKEQYRLGAFATSSNGTKSPTVRMRINKKFEQFLLTANTFCPPGTSVEWTLQTTPGAGAHEFQPWEPYTLVTRNTLKDKLSPVTIVPGAPLEFGTTMMVLAPENEKTIQQSIGSTSAQLTRTDIQTMKSIIVKARLISDNSNISPVLDSVRLAANTVHTRLDNPQALAAASTIDMLGTNIKEDDFDKLTIFEKGFIPLEKNLSASGSVVETVRAPAYGSSATALGQALSFSQATKFLDGTFTQDANSKTITAVQQGASAQGLKGSVIPGDIVINVATGEHRTVVKVVNATKMILNGPFNPPLATSGAKLALANEYMEITTSDAVLAAHLSQMDVGKYASLELYTYSAASAPASLASASGTFTRVTSSSDPDYTKVFDNKLIVGVDYTPDSATTKCKITVQHLNTGTSTLQSTKYVTIHQWDRFIDEISYEGGSCSSKYICKNLMLDKPATALKISFDAIRDEYSFVDLYYRTESPNGATATQDHNWVKATYNIDVDGILTPKSPDPSESEFRTYQTTVGGLTEFSGVQAKVVFRGGNPAKPPKIKNFTLIALDE